jgi:hypothetical protein
MGNYEDERKAAEEAVEAKILDLYKKIVAEVVKAGGTDVTEDFRHDGYKPKALFSFAKNSAGPAVSVEVQFLAERDGPLFHRKCTGKVQIRVEGSYHNKKIFKDRKNGHDLGAVVASISDIALKEKEKKVAQAAYNRKENNAFKRADEMNERHGVSAERPYSYEGPYIKVENAKLYLVLGTMNEPEMEAVLGFIMEMRNKPVDSTGNS